MENVAVVMVSVLPGTHMQECLVVALLSVWESDSWASTDMMNFSS